MRQEEQKLIEALQPVLSEAVDRRFHPGFADRVMERIQASAPTPTIQLTTALSGHFLKLAPLAAAVLIALGAYNLGNSGSAGQSTLEAALGLEPVTLETAYAFEQVPYTENGD